MIKNILKEIEFKIYLFYEIKSILIIIIISFLALVNLDNTFFFISIILTLCASIVYLSRCWKLVNLHPQHDFSLNLYYRE